MRILPRTRPGRRRQTETAPIIQRIIEAAPGLHSAGPLRPRVLETITLCCQEVQLRHTVETGCGASTLLFSHLSEQHTVFVDTSGNDSLASVKRSSLLRPEVVTFVEGPTQLTLPKYKFEYSLDCVVLDGPHGYPFPDLEYYYLYPRLSVGALLILDDIQIRTINNLFRFLRADAMFHLECVVDTTAIFRRTNAPTFDPNGDGWWSQEFNRRVLVGYAWRDLLKDLLPRRLRPKMRRVRQRFANGWGAKISIVSPRRGQEVGPSGLVIGVAKLPSDWQLWVLVHRKDFPGWWPQGGGPAAVENGTWRLSVAYGEDRDMHFPFEICALAIRGEITKSWLEWIQRARATEDCSPLLLPPATLVLTEAYRTVYRDLSS